MKTVTTIAICLFWASLSVAAPPKDAKKVKQYLKGFGYEVTINKQQMVARHKEDLSFVIEDYSYGMLFSSRYQVSSQAKKKSRRFLEWVNTLNQNAITARYYLDSSNHLTMECYYPGRYHKKFFKPFFEACSYENINLGKHPNELNRFIK